MCKHLAPGTIVWRAALIYIWLLLVTSTTVYSATQSKQVYISKLWELVYNCLNYARCFRGREFSQCYIKTDIRNPKKLPAKTFYAQADNLYLQSDGLLW